MVGWLVWSFLVPTVEILLLLLSVAFFTLLERKVMASVQIRLGPNKSGFVGTLQPLADGLKLLRKEQEAPSQSIKWVFLISPGLSFFLSMSVWALTPSEWGCQTWTLALVLLGLYFGLSVFGIIVVGWFSNSKYASLGAVRGICQSISYEIGLALVIVLLGVTSSSLSLEFYPQLQELELLVFPLLPLFLAGWVSLLAETGRSPFDLSEGESELVSGYSVEYGGTGYTLVFLSENVALLWISWLISWLFLFPLSPVLLFSLSAFIRAGFPRLRFDKMMSLFWLMLLPSMLGFGSLLTSLLFS